MNEQERKAFIERVAAMFNQGLTDADIAEQLGKDGYPVINPLLNKRTAIPLIEAYISIIRDLIMDTKPKD